MIRSTVLALSLLLIFTLLASPVVEGEEDRVYFNAEGAWEEETTIAYVGETHYYLNIEFGRNYTTSSLEVETPLFEHSIHDNTLGKAKAGTGAGFAVGLNGSAPPGEYNVTVYLNYTDEEGNEMNNTFPFLLHYLKSFEVTKLNLPKGSDHTFSVEVTTFIEFTSFLIMFDSDGDLEIDPEERTFYDLMPGNHTFKAVVERDYSLRDDQQEVGYHIIARIGNRTIEKVEKNINVNVSGSGFVLNSVGNGEMAIVLAVVSGGMTYRRSCKRNNGEVIT